MSTLDDKINEHFAGFVVRKDLVRKYSRQYPVPTYVVEFLLGRYCASIDDNEINEGLQIVEKQLQSFKNNSGFASTTDWSLTSNASKGISDSSGSGTSSSFIVYLPTP